MWRARSWRYGALLGVLGLLVLGSCGGEEASPAALRVTSAREVFVLPRHAAIQGRDGGSSGLAFGRSVWAYGDTVLDVPDARGEQWHTNSAATAEVVAWKAGFETTRDAAGVPDYFIARTDEEIAWDNAHAADPCEAAPCGSRWAIWPGPPLFDAASQRAWIFYGLYNDHNPSGIGVAVWRGLDQRPERVRVGDSWLLFTRDEPEYINAPIVRDGHLYAFGCVLKGWDRPCTLGRAPIAQVAERAAWRFFDGEVWVEDFRRARTLFDGHPIMSVGWNAHLERFVLITSPPFERGVFARTATRLEGPWSDPKLLFETPDKPAYDAIHHPELEEEGGRVQYISYSRPTGRGWFGAEHAIWRVELSREGE